MNDIQNLNCELLQEGVLNAELSIDDEMIETNLINPELLIENDHRNTTNKDAVNQHPIKAIINLTDILHQNNSDIETLQLDVIELNTLTSSLQTNVAEHHANIQQIKAKESVFETNFNQIDNDIKNVQNKLSSLDESVQTNTGKITLLDDSVDEIQVDISQIEYDLQGLNDELSSIKSDLSDTDNKLDAAIIDITNTNNRITAVEEDVVDLEDYINDEFIKSNNQKTKTNEDAPIVVDNKGKLWVNTQTIVPTYSDLPMDKKVGTVAMVLQDGEEIDCPVTELYEGQHFPQITIKESGSFDYLEGVEPTDEIYALIGEASIEILNEFGEPFLLLSYETHENDKDNFVMVAYTPKEIIINLDGLEITLPAGWCNIDPDTFIPTSISYDDIPVVHQENVVVESIDEKTNYLYPFLSLGTEIVNPKGEYIKKDDGWVVFDRNGIIVKTYNNLPQDVKTGTTARVLDSIVEKTQFELTELIEGNRYSIAIKEEIDFSYLSGHEIDETIDIYMGDIRLELNSMFGTPFLVLENSDYRTQHSYSAVPFSFEMEGLLINVPAGWNLINPDYTFQAVNYNEIPGILQNDVIVTGLGESYEYLLPCLTLFEEKKLLKGIYGFNGKSWERQRDFVEINEQTLTDENKRQIRKNIGIETIYYEDLENRPTIPTNNDFTLSGLSEKSYNSLTDQPTIPTNNDFTLSGLSEKSYNSLTDQPTVPINNDFTLLGLGEKDFASLTNKPNSLIGYGILDGVDTETTQFVGGQKFFTEDTHFQGNLYAYKNIYQSGSLYETHVEQVKVRNSLIFTRLDALSGLGINEFTGIQAIKYDGINDGQLVFDVNGVARVGDVGDTQPLATREEVPTNTGIARWNSSNSKFVTEIPDTAPTVDSTKLVTSGGVYNVLNNYVPYTDSTADLKLGTHNLFAKNLGANSTSGNTRLNVVGDNTTDRLPITFFPTDQEKSQIISLQGKGNTRLWISNNEIYGKELQLGVDDSGNGYLSVGYGNSFRIKTGSSDRLEVKSDGKVYINGMLILQIETGSERPDKTTIGEYVGQLYLYDEDKIGKLYYLSEIYSNPETGLDEYKWRVIDCFTTNATTGHNSFISNNENNTATGDYSLAVNSYTSASGNHSLAINSYTSASGTNSFACGFSTKASGNSQFVCGQDNAENTDALLIVGDGDTLEKHNALEVEIGRVKINGILELNGDEFGGDLTAAGISYDNTTSGLSETNVQTVIDALKVITSNLDSNKVNRQSVTTKANDIKVTGFYTLPITTSTGVPDTNHSWFLMHQHSSATSAMQVACAYGVANDINSLMYYLRVRFDTSWGDWIRIGDMPTGTGILTLNANDWVNNSQIVSLALDTNKRNVIDIEPSSRREWATMGVFAEAETSTDITFTCTTPPTNDLYFRVVSTGCSYAN